VFLKEARSLTACYLVLPLNEEQRLLSYDDEEETHLKRH